MMKKLQKILLLFFKSKYIWIPLLAVSIVLQLIGIATLIGIHSYQLKPKDGTFGSWQYSYELSEKSALDTWEKNTTYYNQSQLQDQPSLNQKTFGEFRTWVELSKNADGTETVKLLFGDGKTAQGSLYINGKKYSAQLDPQTGGIVYDQSDRSDRLGKWHWYTWLGLRAPEWYTSHAPFFFEK